MSGSTAHAQWVVQTGGSSVNTLFANGTTIIGGTNGAGSIFYGSGSGTNWYSTLNPGIPTGADVRAFGANSSYVFAGSQSGLFRCINDGNYSSWTNVLAGGYWSLLVNGSEIFAGTLGAGVFHSTDNGANWTQSMSGMESYPDPYALVSNGTYLFAGMYAGNGSVNSPDAGVYRSDDNGVTWTQKINGLTNHDVFSLAVKGGYLFAGTNGGIFRSSDNGDHWTFLADGAVHTIKIVCNSDIYAGLLNNGGVSRSSDDGVTWTSYSTGMNQVAVMSLALIGPDLFAGTLGQGVFKANIGDCPASTSSICGTKYNDINGNGLQDNGEPGLQGWTINLAYSSAAGGPVTLTTTTGANGSYCFDNLTANTYTISETQQSGWTQISPAAPGTHIVILATGISASGQDFGNQQILGSICGLKFNDINGDGIQNNGEPGLSGWTINLTYNLATGPVTVTTTTDATGNYCFNNLGAGSYAVSETQKSGWTQTFPAAPGTYSIRLSLGLNLVGQNFGNQQILGSICGMKFNDINGDGIQNNGEPGLSGWTINLTYGGLAAAVTLTTTTGADGSYCFNNLTANTYTVSETQQSGWTQISPAVPGTYSVNLTSGLNVVNQNFGNHFCIPTITGTTPGSTCGTGTVTLGATASSGTINWYNTLAGGTLLGTGNSFLTPSIATTTTYYVDATSACGTTAVRTAVVATFIAIPTAILTSSDADNTFNAGTSVTFTAGGGTNYDFRVNGASVQNGVSNTYTTSTLTNGQVVDVIVTNSSGCIVTSSGITNSVIQTACINPPANMIAWWSLDETDISNTGSISNDLAGFNNVGARTNSPVPVPAMVLGGLQFDGIDDYVEVPDHAELNFGLGNLSFDAWILTTTVIGVEELVDKRLSITQGLFGYAFFLNNGKLSLELADGTWANYFSPVFVADGKWHHIAVTVSRTDPNGIIFYLDGVPTPYGDPTSHAASLDNSGKLRIGGNSQGVVYQFKGILDEIEMFNRVITKDEIISIFNAGSAGKCKPKGLLGSICGMKFNDANGNGTQDTGELGLSDWEISLTYLLSGVSTTVKTTTGADGSYCFNDLAAGIYTIKETPKDNWVQKYPVPGTYSITLTTGQKVIDKNFGNYLCNLTITGTTPGSRCGTGTVTLGATASAGTINWYSTLIGGSSLGTGTSYTTPSISTTTTYYAEATDNGCTTAVRTAVVATVKAIPIVSAPVSVNVGSTITLSPTTGGTWTSSNPFIASVTNTGVVTGLSAGTATFTFTNTITGCNATTSSVTVVGLLNCDQLSATASKVIPGDCLWSLSLTQPANLTGISAIQVLALSPNQFATGTGLGSAYTSWLASGTFATGETYYPPTGIVSGGNLSNFLTMNLSYVTSPQTIVVNWLDATGKVVCSKSIQLNCQTTCVGVINEAVTCVGNNYNLAYSFTNNATYPIHTIDYSVQSPGSVTISPTTVILATDVASTSNSGIQNILISGAVPGDHVSIVARFMKSTGCCWCFDTLHLIIPTCPTVCDSLSIQAQGTPEGCCYSVSLTNNSSTKFSNVQFELLSGGIFGSMSTATSGFAMTNVTPFNLINLVKLPPVSGVIGNGTFTNALNMCIRQYTSPNQVVEVRWMKDGKVICRDTLRFNCIGHPTAVGCSQPLEGTLECLKDGTVKYNFRIQNNSNFDATGFNISPTASNVTFSQTAFSNVPILSGGQVSTVQSIILSGAGVGQGQNICFTITIFKAISGTGSTVYSDCCHTDTICVVSPVCGEQLGSICGMKFSDDNGNGSQDTGELGLAGWTISLTSYNLLGAATTVTAITDATGAYCFTNLAADTYTIKETQKSGWTQTFPAGTGIYSITLTAGAKIENQNFGNQQIPTNIPCVYLCNTDFEQFLGVTPPSGFSWFPQANIPCWKTTASDGLIEIWHTGFGLVPAYTGNYFAELNATQVGTLYQTFTANAPQSVIVSFAHRGRYAGLDVMKVSIVDPGGTATPLGTYSDNNSAWNFYSTAAYSIATSGTYTLKFESVSSNNGTGPPDGGNFLDDINVTCPSSICGIKYNDLNGDGQKQAAEPVLPNWEIKLAGPLTMTVTTGADGSYCFNNLTPGTYTVSETPQGGWTQSFPAGSGTHTVTLTVGQSVINQDFGNHLATSSSPCTDFEDGTVGTWQVDNTLSSIIQDGTNHYIQTTDESGASSLFNTSAPLTGDWTNQLVNGCGSLCFDVNFLFAGNPYGGVNPPSTFTPYIAITGNGFSAYFVTNPISAGSGWHTYCAPLNYLNLDGTLPANSNGHWVMGVGSNSDWNSLLSNVTRVSLPVDPTSYQGEQFGYDNICLKNTGDCTVPCCDKVTVEPLLDASGKTTCCAKITATCEVKSIGVTVTNGTLSSVSWNCSATIPSDYIGQSAVTFIPNGCAPILTTCVNAKVSGVVTITYDIVFSDGETCQKKVEMNCGVPPPSCCDQVKVEPVVDASGKAACSAKITTTCEVKAIAVTVTNGTLSSANWNCTTAIPTGFIGLSAYTFAPGSCLPEMTTSVDAIASGTVTVTYDITFSNGDICQKSVQLDCSVPLCCDKVTVEPVVDATGKASCCAKITATCEVKAIAVTVTNGKLRSANWNCPTTIPTGYVGQSAYTFAPGGCIPVLTTCVDAINSGMVMITYDIDFANGETCQKTIRLDCAVASDCVNAPTGLVLWLTGDDNTSDISGLNNNGTLAGGATYSTGKVAAAFKVGNFLDKISVADNSSLNFGTGNFSADAWFKTTDNIHFISIADKSVSSGNNMIGYRLFIIQGYLYFQMGDGSVPLSEYVQTVQLADGVWHFVGVTIDRKLTDGGKLYIDGSPVLTFDPTTKPNSISNTIPLTVGGNNMVNLTASNQFTFYLDEVELFNRAITGTEISSIFNAGSAGKCKLGSICGTKFNDLNGNGRRDKDEPGIPDWKIVIGGTADLSTVTDKDGNFCFYNLEPGEYKIGEETRNGWQQILPSAPGTYTVTLPAGQNLAGINFGNRLIPQTGSICGSKFNDLNGNGIRDNDEPGIGDWTIHLAGVADLTVTTDKNGDFCFNDLKPGTYKLSEESRTGWLQMEPAGGYYAIVLEAGDNLINQDFGNMLDSKPGSICGIKFNDLNGNGTQDSNEPGLPNWTINLNGLATMTAVTDGKGRFCFTDLKPGTYTLSETNQPLWHQTAPRVLGGTYTITLVADEHLENQNFGNQHDLECVTPPIGMLGWWPGDDNANDISSNGDYGTLVNGATFAPGMVGSAFSLMGSTDYISIPDRPQLNPGNGDFTIDCWIKTSEAVGTFAILDKQAFDANQNVSGYGLYVVDGFLQLRLSDSAGNGFGAALFNDNTTMIADGLWHFVAVTIQQGTNHAVTLIVDGETGVGNTWGLPYLNYSNNAPLRIGEAYYSAYSNNSPAGHYHNFQGLIDEVEFILGAVSQTELAGIYNAGSAGKCKPAVLLGSICGRKFNDKNGNGLIDARGDGEPGIPNWTIKLTGAANMTATTDAVGNFCFNNLPSGQYTIAEVNQPGWIQTAPLNPNTYTVTLNPGEHIEVLNFGNKVDPTFGCVPSPAGLVGWWPLDGHARDISGLNNHGTLEGGASYVSGKVAQGLNVVNSADYISVPDNSSLNFGTSTNFSIDAWIKTKDRGDINYDLEIVDKSVMSYDYTNPYYLGYDLRTHHGNLDLLMGTGSSWHYYSTTNLNFADGNWHLVAVTVDRTNSSGGRMYVDGNMVLTFDPTIISNSISNTAPLIIAGHSIDHYLTSPYEDQVDEVELFNRAITGDEINSIYNAGSSGKCKLGTICGMKFNDLNGNGKMDAGEPGISGWLINLSGDTNTTVLTDKEGRYCFTNLTPGQYKIGEEVREGWTQTAPGTPGNFTLTLPAGGNLTGYYFGNTYRNTTGCVTPPLGMVAWWPLDETDISKTGSISNDLAGFNNIGMRINGPTPVPGMVLSGLQFNGANYVEVPDQAELNFGTGDFSFDAWIQTTMTTGAGDLVDKRSTDNGYSGYSFFINDGKLSLELANGTLTNYVSPVFVADGKWHHVAVTVSRANPKGILFYIDGVPTQYGDPTTHLGSLDVKGPLRLGSQSFAAGYLFSGILDEVELFNRVITKDEIASIFNAGSSGKCKLGSICGAKYNDLNGNGRRDDGEPGIPDWQIMLDGTARLTAVTDKEGNYCFTNLVPGDYKIHEELRPDWQQKAPAEGYYGVTLTSGQNMTGKDFGNMLNSQLGSICGMKFNDLNGNGIRDKDEPGIPDWTILLGGTADFSVQTDKNGEFCFLNLKPGTYKIGEQARDSWIQTAPSSSYFTIELKTGDHITGKEFGNMLDPKTGSICGMKFNDVNGNGIMDNGELGIPDWTINLTGPANMTMQTDKRGNFCFTNLPAGTYIVSEGNRSGWYQTTPESGMYSVTLKPGDSVIRMNFGNTNDPCFNEPKLWSPLGPGINDIVLALTVSGTDLYAGGKFDTFNGYADDVAKWNGTGWSALQNYGVSSWVYSLASKGSDVYIGGIFGNAGWTPVLDITKWDGTTFSALGGGLNTYVRSLTVLGNDVYAGGVFLSSGMLSANHIAKWDGTSWSALNSGTNGAVLALTSIGGDLYAGGQFTTAGGLTANRIAKWNGANWSVLGSGLNGDVEALAVDGSILYAGGSFTLAGGTTVNRIAKWDGTSWTALGSGMNGEVTSLAVMGGELYAGGTFTTAGGITANRIAKWDGSTWTALGAGMNNEVRALAFIGNDLYAGGDFTTADGVSAKYVAKYSCKASTSAPETKLQLYYQLDQNYPNPFSSTTTIGYSVPQTSLVNISVSDIYGKEIKVLVNGEKDPGHYNIVFDRQDLVPGIYFYTLRTTGFIQSKKMIIMK